MKVVALCSYPVEAAATRYRLEQFVTPLARRGIELDIQPFLDSKLFELIYQRPAVFQISVGLLKASLLRLKAILASAKADVLLIQREAMIFGPPLIEWAAARLCKIPLVLDLDDATYVAYSSPTYGRLGLLKWFGKTDTLIRWSRLVVCGNNAIAQYASSKGAEVRVLPTIVDAERFRPAKRAAEGKLTLGWIGTHSTFPYLRSIFPALQQLAGRCSFRLKIVGAGKNDIEIPGVEIENLKWELKREVEDFQSLDIGLYPIDPLRYTEQWAGGKSGFKAIQYMAVGIPYVSTPVGGATEIGVEGETHFFATSNEEWIRALGILISDRHRREEMGGAGRTHVLTHYNLEQHANALASLLHEAVKRR